MDIKSHDDSRAFYYGFASRPDWIRIVLNEVPNDHECAVTFRHRVTCVAPSNHSGDIHQYMIYLVEDTLDEYGEFLSPIREPNIIIE